MKALLSAFTIKAKIILAYTILFGVLISAFAFAVYRSTRDAKIARTDALLSAHAGKLLTEIEEDLDKTQTPEAANLAPTKAEGLSGVRLQLLLPSGKAIGADSLLFQSTTKVPGQVWQGNAESQTIRIHSRSYRALWQPVEIDERIPYVLEVVAPLDDVAEDLERLRLIFLIAIPVSLLLTGLAAYAITGAAFRPITAMIETTRSITASSLHARLDLPRADDEVRRLGETLNDLMERLDTAFNSQRQFVADASHELRTPLAVIRSELEYALVQTADAAAKESILASLDEIDRLTHMTSQLLMLTRLDSSAAGIDFQTMRVDELLVECVQFYNGLAAKRGIIIEIFIESAAEIRGDYEKLKSVVLNLLDNAIKYSPNDSVVTATLSLDDSQSVAQISIEDNGPGISAVELEKIFKRFYRGDGLRGNSEGSGLGLAIARRIIELHDSKISVESEVGKGTKFIVEVPTTRSI
jgi:heavy metal sensor kinase